MEEGATSGLKKGHNERDRQTDRQRQRDRETERDRDRETDQMKSNKSLLFINIQSIKMKIFLGYMGSRRYI